MLDIIIIVWHLDTCVQNIVYIVLQCLEEFDSLQNYIKQTENRLIFNIYNVDIK